LYTAAPPEEDNGLMQVDAAIARIAAQRRGRHLLLLFDFDGTLVPFQPDPAAVYLDPAIGERLTRLAIRADATLGIISGRRLPDLQGRLAVGGEIYLAGFHGLEIQAPGGEIVVHPAASGAVQTMQAIAAAARPRLGELPGVFIEDKHFSIALHYREAAPAVRVVAIARFMDAARADVDAGRVRLLPGDCVVELLPAAAWHKGSALQWIRERVERLHGPTFTVYVGDDVTDEDAFRAVGPEGMAISASERATGAQFSVSGPEGVSRLLHSLDGPENNRRA
jgi:alpha,alpha-trehalase